MPFTKDGVKACKALASEGKRVNVTLIFSADAGWLAAKAGATYVSPFVGRLDDIGTTGMGSSARSSTSSTTSSSPPKCSSPACGTRFTSSKRRAWAPTSCTVPAAVIEQCFKHPLTDIGLEKFLKDWEKAQAAKV